MGLEAQELMPVRNWSDQVICSKRDPGRAGDQL
jgi:hypothetical protein